MNLIRLLSMLCCLLVLQGCFENSDDKDKDNSKSSVQMTQPDKDEK